jgi:hypothetical protein
MVCTSEFRQWTVAVIVLYSRVHDFEWSSIA